MSVAASGVIINTIGTIIFLVTGSHGHSHGGHGHGHSHGGGSHSTVDDDGVHEQHELDEHEHLINDNDHEDLEKEHHDEHDHDEHKDHEHDHGHEEKGHGHSHGKKEKKKKMNVNVYAMLIHFLGDALSSFLVLIAGLLLYFFPKEEWVKYVDPTSSILIVIIVLWTTVPLLKRCSEVLMQKVPTDIELGTIRASLKKVPGVLGVHEFHVWPLVEETIICSVHITCEEGCDFNGIALAFRQIFHQHNIHSTSIQPEFVPIHHPAPDQFCKQNCVEDCKEDWCCKESSERSKKSESVGNSSQ